jgi:glutathione S-transferase
MLRKVAQSEHDIVAFIPSIYSFSVLVSTKWATVLGLMWCLGRWAYHNTTHSARAGYRVSMMSQLALLLGSLTYGLRLAFWRRTHRSA